MENLETIIKDSKHTLLNNYPNSNISLIDKAIIYAKNIHQSEKRLSGDNFFYHPAEVAKIIAFEMNLDDISVAAAYLHDVLSKDPDLENDLLINFGEEITNIVKGVYHISKYRSKGEERAANYRKMIQIAVLDDMRIVFVKLADRLHNMRTLRYMPFEKQLEKSQETMELFAPTAHRLGLYRIKSELEDLAFKYSDSENYRKIATLLDEKKEQRENFTNEIIAKLKNILLKLNIDGDVTGRAKHIFSIYEKMERSNKNFDQLYDLLAFRIIVNKNEECYMILGQIHSQFKAIPGRFKDYISMPKVNGYQSLHTAVISKEGRTIEIQIRTHKMDKIAENGVAAHWAYKEDKNAIKEQEEINIVKKIIKEFDNSLSDNIKAKDIYIFTPGGDVIIMPEGATVLDFAYYIHTEVGNQCIGANVDGTHVSIRQVLKSGQKVSIIKNKKQKPKNEWLDIVSTNRAKSKISNYLNKEERNQAMEIGFSIFEREFSKIGLNFNKLNKEGILLERAKLTRYSNVIEVAIALGYGKIDIPFALSKILPEENLSLLDNKEEEEKSKYEKFFKNFNKSSSSKSGVIVDGLENVLIKYAKCCNPIPPEDIVGYISIGFGVTIHKKKCINVKNFAKERLIEVQWGGESVTRPIITRVQAVNKVGVLSEITKLFSKLNINIESITTKMDENSGVNFILLTLSISNIDTIKTIKNKILKVDGVINVDFRRNF